MPGAKESEINTSATSAQVTWLKKDIAANLKKCVMAYWHRARWSSGSEHGSSTKMSTIWNILYDAKAELVIVGQEHNYERFTPMNKTGQTVDAGLQEIVVRTGGRKLSGFGSILPAGRARNAKTYSVLKLTLNTGSYSWKFIPIAGSSFTDSGSRSCH